MRARFHLFMQALLLYALLGTQSSVFAFLTTARTSQTSSAVTSTILPEGIPDGARELMINSLSDVTVPSTSVATKGAKGKPVRLNAKQRSGYKYQDKDGEYDVPIIDSHMWYRVNVRKASEKKLCELFAGPSSALDAKWSKIVVDAYYPQSPYVGFKGKNIELKVKPMIPGLLYIKTKMGPDVADELEKVQGIYGFTKTAEGIVVPLGEEEANQLESMKNKERQDLTPEIKKIKKEEYVSVVSGEHAGRYGIVMGAKAGKIEVCLRSEYKDDWDVFNVFDLRYLDKPPEKKWKEMTAKEAVESLMAKDPKSPTIRSLKEQGLLEEILYPDGRPQKKPRREMSEGGREGGRSIRSIASPKRSKDAAGEAFQSFVDDLTKGDDSALSSQKLTPAHPWNTGKGLRESSAEEFTATFESVDSFIADRVAQFDTNKQTTPSQKGLLEGDLDFDDLLADDKDADGKKAKTNSRDIRMEDFGSFEEYLDALVNLEKEAPASPGKKISSSDTKKSPVSKSTKSKEDSFFDMLAAEVSSEKMTSTAPRKRIKHSLSDTSPVARASYASNVNDSNKKKSDSLAEFDDLDEFFKSLE